MDQIKHMEETELPAALTGGTIIQVLMRATELAKRSDKVVKFSFNTIQMKVTPSSCMYDQLRIFELEQKLMQKGN